MLVSFACKSTQWKIFFSYIDSNYFLNNPLPSTNNFVLYSSTKQTLSCLLLLLLLFNLFVCFLCIVCGKQNYSHLVQIGSGDTFKVRLGMGVKYLSLASNLKLQLPNFSQVKSNPEFCGEGNTEKCVCSLTGIHQQTNYRLATKYKKQTLK